MVVLLPGGVIRPEDIPPEIRHQVGRSRMLPVPIPRLESEPSQTAPELEFIFRTLVQLRIDVEDLRHQFDDYRQAHPELGPVVHRPFVLPGARFPAVPGPVEILAESYPAVAPADADTTDEHDVVVYRPGMTLQDLEKNAIVAALREVAGNRRKAAEMLGMGERTLYRKIKDYGILSSVRPSRLRASSPCCAVGSARAGPPGSPGNA
jgi:DNA-binding NtrC family response regulator